MKTFLISLLTVCLALFVGCRQDETPQGEKSALLLKGVVVNNDGSPVADVEVNVGSIADKTDANGSFELRSETIPDRIVLNLSKNGYIPISKIYSASAVGQRFVIREASVFTVDVSQPFVATSSATNCDRSYENPLKNKNIQPKVFKNGKLSDFAVPDVITNHLKNRTSPATCNTGSTIRIPANSVVNADGSDLAAGEEVYLAIATLDAMTPDGMPGDYSARSSRQETAMMESFGAASIELYGRDKSFSLRKGTKAELTIPVNPYIDREFVPMEIPLLWYNPENGVWEQEGNAVYVDSLNAFTGQVGHFSSFNMDMLKIDPACATFCLTEDPAGSIDLNHCSQDDDSDGTPDNNTNSRIRITAVAPSGSVSIRTALLQCNSCTGASLCALPFPCAYNYRVYNLFPGPDSYLLIEHFEPGTPDIIKGLYVVDVGDEPKDNPTDLQPDCGTGVTAYPDCKQFIPVKIPEAGDPDYIFGAFDTIPLAMNQITGTTARIVFLYNSDPSALTFEYSLWDGSVTPLPSGATCNVCGDPTNWAGGAFAALSVTGVQPVDPDEDLTPDYWIIRADITGLTSTVQYVIKIREQASGLQSTCVYANIP